MKNRGIKNVLKLAALAIMLPYGGFAAASSARPVVVTSVDCDNEYGLAMESAILEGNIRRVDALLSSSRGTINDVLAVSSRETRWTTWNAISIYQKSRVLPRAAPTGNSYGNPCDEMHCLVNLSRICPMPKGDCHRMVGRVSDEGRFDNGLPASVDLLGTPLMIAVRAQNRFMVAELLKRGANPNVFIEVQDYQPDSTYTRQDATGTWTCRRPYLCALFDAYLKMDPESMDKADAIAKMLLDHGASFYKRPDDYGRTAIWDAARLKSPYLLSEMVKRGFDLSIEDNVGKTVADWASMERPAGVPGQALQKRFVRALQEMGVQIPDGPSPSIKAGPETRRMNEDDFAAAPCEGGTARPNGPVAAAVPSPALPPPAAQKPDHSAEIAMLQSRIWKLRMELEDARGNERAAAVQGTGWVTASMRTMDIMREISECESRIMQLRD